MNNLTSKQQAFVNLMTQDEEYERRGFELLLLRANFAEFFDALAAAGIFNPSRNSGPIEGDQPGYYRVPYWQPLGYLEAAAKTAGDTEDSALANKIMNIIRQVTLWRDSGGKVRDNHNTWRTFAKIYGLLPVNCISYDDIDLIQTWIPTGFDRSAVGFALATGTLRHFIESEDQTAWKRHAAFFITARQLTGNAVPMKKIPSAPRRCLRTIG
jgi:hypothetical protein